LQGMTSMAKLSTYQAKERFLYWTEMNEAGVMDLTL
jgi:hypothetical protein